MRNFRIKLKGVPLAILPGGPIYAQTRQLLVLGV